MFMKKKNINKESVSQRGIFVSKKTNTDIPYKNKLEKDFYLTNEFDFRIIDYYPFELSPDDLSETENFNELSLFVVVYFTFHSEIIVLAKSRTVDNIICSAIENIIKNLPRNFGSDFILLNGEEFNNDILIENLELIYKSSGKTVSEHSLSVIEHIFEENDSVSLNDLKKFMSEEEIFTLILKSFLKVNLSVNLINNDTEISKKKGTANNLLNISDVFLGKDPERPEDLDKIF